MSQYRQSIPCGIAVRGRPGAHTRRGRRRGKLHNRTVATLKKMQNKKWRTVRRESVKSQRKKEKENIDMVCTQQNSKKARLETKYKVNYLIILADIWKSICHVHLRAQHSRSKCTPWSKHKILFRYTNSTQHIKNFKTLACKKIKWFQSLRKSVKYLELFSQFAYWIQGKGRISRLRVFNKNTTTLIQQK